MLSYISFLNSTWIQIQVVQLINKFLTNLIKLIAWKHQEIRHTKLYVSGLLLSPGNIVDNEMHIMYISCGSNTHAIWAINYENYEVWLFCFNIFFMSCILVALNFFYLTNKVGQWTWTLYMSSVNFLIFFYKML